MASSLAAIFRAWPRWTRSLLAGGGDQDRWISLARLGGGVGGYGVDVAQSLRACRGLPYSAIQLAPACSRWKRRIVDERDGTEQRTERLGKAGQHVGDQQPAVGRAFGGDPLRGERRRRTRSAATAAKSSGAGLALAPPRVVPPCPELAAAANTGGWSMPPRSSQSCRGRCCTGGSTGDAETAIAGEEYRGVTGLACQSGLDIWDALAVAGDRLMACHGGSVGIER